MNSDEFDDFNYTKNMCMEDANNKKFKSRFEDLKIFHKFLDSLNLSLFLLIFIFSYISINSQKNWTNLYSALIQLRAKNYNLVDYISKTQGFYL